jgi:hypothetical protein
MAYPISTEFNLGRMAVMSMLQKVMAHAVYPEALKIVILLLVLPLIGPEPICEIVYCSQDNTRTEYK